jgi:hypothetical protein
MDAGSGNCDPTPRKSALRRRDQDRRSEGNRIPIYAVPAVLNGEAVERYRAVYQRAEEATAVGDLDLANRLFEELNRMGDYMPCFAQMPSATNSVREVYPQGADDLSIVLELVDGVIGHLEPTA